MPKCPRIVVFGSKKVGKSAIIEQLVHGHHNIGAPLHPTIEDIHEVLIETEYGVKERVRIFDTAGLDSNSSDLSKHYLNIADGFVLVYSITSKSSLTTVETIKKEIEKTRGKDQCPLIVLGTKTDLLEQRECDYKAALKWSESEKVKLYEICVGDRQALKEPLVWLVSRISTQTGFEQKSFIRGKACDGVQVKYNGKGYPGRSDMKRFLTKKRTTSKGQTRDNGVSD